eukprot:12269731-Alexandrium_andersonii.AAC.1
MATMALRPHRRGGQRRQWRQWRPRPHLGFSRRHDEAVEGRRACFSWWLERSQCNIAGARNISSTVERRESAAARL